MQTERQPGWHTETDGERAIGSGYIYSDNNTERAGGRASSSCGRVCGGHAARARPSARRDTKDQRGLECDLRGWRPKRRDGGRAAGRRASAWSADGRSRKESERERKRDARGGRVSRVCRRTKDPTLALGTPGPGRGHAPLPAPNVCHAEQPNLPQLFPWRRLRSRTHARLERRLRLIPKPPSTQRLQPRAVPPHRRASTVIFLCHHVCGCKFDFDCYRCSLI
jgi:hypothetical protein